jgi:NADH-quinone oxidoreductase subunit G/NADP-reducing hydrogenase subunit HndD
MIQVEINGRAVEARENETILEVARRAGCNIPTLCHVENLPPSGACRMCVVEVEGSRALIPSCAYPVSAGMKVKTHTSRVLEARRTIAELLLANHPNDCTHCARNHKCQLQDLSAELGVRDSAYVAERQEKKLDISSPSIVRDPNKCILCGRCVRVCEEVQGVSAIDFVGRGSKTTIGTAFNQGLNVSSCINCGQCIVVCPTAALTEQSHVARVVQALNDPGLTCVVQHAPSISVTLAEEFGAEAGSDVNGKMVALLRRLGFKKVFDTSFSADLTIMEEASELVQRITTGGTLPMMTSCSPGWTKFVEQFYPEFIGNLSTCKSPQQMLGAVIKSYFAQRENLDPKKIYSVAIMPCTAKKFEAGRPEMEGNGVPDVDAVLTTRELADLIRMYGLSLDGVEAETADNPFGTRSTAGKLFGASGGVMEAAIRTAHYLLTGKELAELKVEAVRGMEGRKEAKLTINGVTVGVAVVNGLGKAHELFDEIRSGRSDLHFVEVMTCPGGCIAGGGQPIGTDLAKVRKRMQVLHQIDRQEGLRTSHGNPEIRELYEKFLGKPLGERSHKLLHTHYHERDVLR